MRMVLLQVDRVRTRPASHLGQDELYTKGSDLRNILVCFLPIRVARNVNAKDDEQVRSRWTQVFLKRNLLS